MTKWISETPHTRPGRPGLFRHRGWRSTAALVALGGLLLSAQVGQASLGGTQAGAPSNEAREVRIATVEGFNLAFMLVDPASQSRTQEGELLLFIGGPDGRPVRDAAVKYTVVNPQGEKRVASAEAARGGYRALVDWQAPGTYLVQAEVKTEKGSLSDQFVCLID
ncbi:hypothetical protein DESUT3_29330 [Desulfuromonas versatilis]|uniref:YtkA-like domain-containing protein n=1 Tax=Desulfuromonas versatilis TaxID=2802975 RepID=A0ABN6E0U9_9BACT|nr:hypothetical protein [Desulfuromonas versatilis]BCR05864.1 hypothetical protein DESUT3_29330 [Desulfuromonas versatilis]